jgi:hypothetical protein
VGAYASLYNINNKTTLFIPPILREQLVAESLRQNYEVFSAPGLRVVAALWGYALMTKFDRMAGGGGSRMILMMLLTTFTNILSNCKNLKSPFMKLPR